MRRSGVRRLLIAAIVVVVLLFALIGSLVTSILIQTPSGGLGHRPADGLYGQAGDFVLGNGNRLHIEVTNGLVWFNLRDASGNLLCDNKELHPSHYQRWVFFVESSGRLWMYSSDIGTYAWQADPQGVWKELDLAPGSPMERRVPQRLIDALGPRRPNGMSSAGADRGG